MDGHEIVYRFSEYIYSDSNHPYYIEARYSLTHSLTHSHSTVTNEIEIEKIATTTPHHTTTRVLVRDTRNKKSI